MIRWPIATCFGEMKALERSGWLSSSPKLSTAFRENLNKEMPAISVSPVKRSIMASTLMLMVLEPENQTLKVDQVRQMQRDLVYRPYEGRRRVCILAASDRMAPNMSNVLLKTLEEPPLHTVIILLANNTRLLLPTILSRCQPIHFNPLPIPLVSQWLMKQRGLDEREAHLLASLSEGSPGKAVEIQEEIRHIPREELLKEWVGLKALPFEKMEGWIESSAPPSRESPLDH